MKGQILYLLFFILLLGYGGHKIPDFERFNVDISSREIHDRNFEWKMIRTSGIDVNGTIVSTENINTGGWLTAFVPGTVLNSLGYDSIYLEPYYGLNNKFQNFN